MRISYSDDEDFPGQFELWQANCQRSLHGKIGQQELRELQAALLALPEKRLIYGLLVDDENSVCAIGAYARYKGLDLAKFDPQCETDEVGVAAGMPPLVAWKVVELNDVELGGGYYGYGRNVTPEERYERVLAWVQLQLSKE